MRLLVLTTSWPGADDDPAGAFVKELCDELDPLGFQSRVVALRAPEGGALAALAARRTVRLGAGLVEMGARALVARHAGRFDLILSHWLVPSVVLGAALGGLPQVGVAHGGDVRLLRSRPRLRRWVLDNASGVIAVSRAGAAELRGRRTLVVPMGVDERALGPPAPLPAGGPLRLLFVGRLVPIKGLTTLLTAVEGLEGVTLTVVGAGPQSALSRCCPENVSFLGAQPLSARRRLYAAHHLLCVPSVGPEGAPRVIGEAYAAGRAVLAAAVGGVPERVPPRWLLPPGDSVAWRARLRGLRDDPASRLVPSGVEPATWGRVAPEIARFLRAVRARPFGGCEPRVV